MTRQTVDRMTVLVAAVGVALAAGGFAFGGARLAEGIAFGAAIALANWLVLRWIVGRVVGGQVRHKAGFGALVFVKMAALIGIVYQTLHAGWIDPMGFTIGFSALFLGVMLGAALYSSGATADGRR